ncbi:MBL fold metallo-hydrolase [Rhodococcus daqingensis]|uniref:MBL fold metallo-hydrolase n=1 Tax=Rhodococcus daqingensis TaxID=2479363 RepID=A0ABW2S186_9NOCA
MLAGIGGFAAVLGLSACASSDSGQQAAATTTAAAGPPGSDSKLALVLLGTQAGPPVVPDRTGISTALVVDGTPYLVDCGRASVTQYRRSGLKFAALKNIFITHLHADHVADYYNFFMLGGGSDPKIDDAVSGPVQVYGPGPAGGLQPAFGGAPVPTAVPENPTPGLAELTRRCNEAFAYSNNVLMRDTGLQDTAAIAVVNEIALPPIGATFENTHPPTAPFPVMSDDRVRVTATLVPHGPVFPSFGFRFDTEYGSVTFSGDTAISDNLIELARGSDVLVHESVNIEGSQLSTAAKDHMIQSHTQVQEVGSVAERADVPKLVVSHVADFGPTTPNLDMTQWTNWAKQGYSGDVIIGNDLQTITVR